MNTHVMLDLETMGTSSEAAIIAIGAVKFDPWGSGVGDAFYVHVDLESSLACGLKLDGATVRWWLEEDRAEARKALLKDAGQHICDALHGLHDWFGDESLPVWGNGAAFDNVILRTAYTKCGMIVPWSYKHDRCYRTIKACLPAHESDHGIIGVQHHALDDAESQALHLQALMKGYMHSPIVGGSTGDPS